MSTAARLLFIDPFSAASGRNAWGLAMDKGSNRSKDSKSGQSKRDGEPWKLPGHHRERPFGSSLEQAAFICTYLIEQIEASLRRDLISDDEAICIVSDVFHRAGSREHLLSAIETDEGLRSLQNLIETICHNYNNEQGPNDREA
ncbi:MAG: hypothetical protein QF408_13355 [Pirellulales bacterium]|jgi:hypothetical protein|nr:hypothetical protein [Pirellulales bacterium]